MEDSAMGIETVNKDKYIRLDEFMEKNESKGHKICQGEETAA